MLPDIKHHEDGESGVDVGVVLFNLHDDRAGGLHAVGQRCPARTIDAGRSSGELFLEPIEFPEFSLDCSSEFAFRYPPPSFTGRRKVFPEQVVEPVTPNVKREFLEVCFDIEIGILLRCLVEFF